MVATDNRITPKFVTTLRLGEIFVFGSNLAGIHGAGAALYAAKFGSRQGEGFGRVGFTFAIPTKDREIKRLKLLDIQPFVASFIQYARLRPDLTFLVTQIGCGLAGYTPEQIAPLFKGAIILPNICLPEEFWEVLNRE
jgi:hypothetical protein